MYIDRGERGISSAIEVVKHCLLSAAQCAVTRENWKMQKGGEWLCSAGFTASRINCTRGWERLSYNRSDGFVEAQMS